MPEIKLGKQVSVGVEEASNLGRHKASAGLTWGKSIVTLLAPGTVLEVPAAPCWGRNHKIFIGQKLKPRAG